LLNIQLNKKIKLKKKRNQNKSFSAFGKEQKQANKARKIPVAVRGSKLPNIDFSVEPLNSFKL